MMPHPSMPHRIPQVAIVDSNTLAAIGLKQLLQNIMPFMQVATFGSLMALEEVSPDTYFHFFVSIDILLQHRAFFSGFRHKTIVLTQADNAATQLTDFHCLCVTDPEELLVKRLLQLEQRAHGQGQHLPPMPKHPRVLTDREVEVLALVAAGKLNKEIADCLNIGLTTVITHRKNIMEKLGAKSVSALTIYAVMHGYVDINSL